MRPGGSSSSSTVQPAVAGLHRVRARQGHEPVAVVHVAGAAGPARRQPRAARLLRPARLGVAAGPRHRDRARPHACGAAAGGVRARLRAVPGLPVAADAGGARRAAARLRELAPVPAAALPRPVADRVAGAGRRAGARAHVPPHGRRLRHGRHPRAGDHSRSATTTGCPTCCRASQSSTPGSSPSSSSEWRRGDPGDAQDDTGASYAGFFDDDYGELDWSWPADEIHRRVRAWSFMFAWGAGARADLDGRERQLLKTRVERGRHGGAPGRRPAPRRRGAARPLRRGRRLGARLLKRLGGRAGLAGPAGCRSHARRAR